MGLIARKAVVALLAVAGVTLFGMAAPAELALTTFIPCSIIRLSVRTGRFESWAVFWAAFAVGGVIFGAAYLLWLYQRTMLGQVTNGKNLHLADLSFREMAVFAPLIAWAIWIGIYPKPYFDILEKPVAQIVERVRPGYYAGTAERAVATVSRAGAAQ